MAVAFAQDSERIAEAIPATKAARPRPLPGMVRRRGILAKPPGRAMTGERILLPVGDFGILHAIEEIVGFVVGLHMFEAESVILALAGAALWSAVTAKLLAARPFAERQFAARDAVLAGLDPDLVEIF